MAKLKGVLFALAAGLAASSGARAATAQEQNYVFSDLFAVRHEERVPESKIGFGGRLGVGWPIMETDRGVTGIELGIFANTIHVKSPLVGNGRQLGAMYDFTYSFKMDAFTPFVLGGLGAVQDKIVGQRSFFVAYELGGGAKMALGDVLKLRASVVAQDVFDDKLRNDKNSFIDVRVNVGAEIPFGGKEAASSTKVVDTDGDGVPDSIDKCPTVPANTPDGCPAPLATAEPPKDSDGDGVPDDQDACPGTLPGMKVDSRGCPIAQNIVLKGVTFVPGSTELTSDAKKVLDSAAAALAGQPNLKVEVGGHTDSMGNAAKNAVLSQARAESVRKYLIGKGVEGGRLTAKGYGSSKPVADNKTKQGRAENRRVELKIQ